VIIFLSITADSSFGYETRARIETLLPPRGSGHFRVPYADARFVGQLELCVVVVALSSALGLSFVSVC